MCTRSHSIGVLSTSSLFFSFCCFCLSCWLPFFFCLLVTAFFFFFYFWLSFWYSPYLQKAMERVLTTLFEMLFTFIAILSYFLIWNAVCVYVVEMSLMSCGIDNTKWTSSSCFFFLVCSRALSPSLSFRKSSVKCTAFTIQIKLQHMKTSIYVRKST